MVKMLSLDQVNRRHIARQNKKDDRWAVPDRVYREPTIEELRIERDRKYLEENFPDLKKDIIVRVEDL